MNNSKSFLDWCIEILIVLILVLVPVYFTTMIGNAFTIEKHVIFRFCVLMLTIFFLAKVVYEPQKYRFPKLLWAVIGFWVVACLSTAFGLAPQVSLWGIHLRMDGLVNLSFLIAYCLIVYFYTDQFKKANNFLLAIVLGSLPIVIYALFQKFGYDISQWKGVDSSERVFGTTGNPSYLGAYLLFTIPICMYLFSTIKNWLKYIFFLYAFIQIATLILTGARAAYIGLIAEVFIFAFSLLYIIGLKKIAAYILLFFAVISILIAYINIDRNLANKLTGNYYLERLANIGQYESGTGRDRLEMWKIAGKAIVSRPILGSGLTSYAYYFNKYYPNYMDARPDKDRYSNYSHNFFLDYGVSHGLTGIILLLTIIIGLFYYSIKEVLKSQDFDRKIILIALNSAFAGYLIQAQFNIETIITWLYYYTFIGLIMAIVFNQKKSAEKLVIPTVSAFKQIILTIVVIFCLYGTYSLSYLPAAADKNVFYIDNSVKPSGKSTPPYLSATAEDKVAMAEEVKNMVPYFEFSHVKLSDQYFAQTKTFSVNSANDLYEKVISENENTIRINPTNFKNYLSMAVIYSGWAKSNPEKIATAEKYFKQASDMSPNRLSVHYNWGDFYLDMGKITQAQEQYLIAKNLNPNIGETYYNLAKIDYINKNTKSTEENLKKAKELGYVFDEKEFYDMFTITKK